MTREGDIVEPRGSTLKGLNTSKDAGKPVKLMKLNRTVCVRLTVSPEDSAKLSETHALYRDACNFVVPIVCKNKESRLWQRFSLHHEAYPKIRERFPALGAQLACNVIRSVSSAYKTELANHPQQLKQPELKAISFKNPSVHLDKNTITYRDNGTVSLYTLKRRVEATLAPGDRQRLLLASGKRKESNLVLHRGYGKRPDFWELHITIENEVQPVSPSELQTKEVMMGVDVGENNMAAASTGKLWKAGKLKHNRDKKQSLRTRLQRNGSRSAKQHLRKASRRERRHVAHVNHVVSREIVNEAKGKNKKLIILEDLTHIRDRIKANLRVRARLHRWPFRELQQMIVYKAVQEGMGVMFVDSHYTSQTCAHCGKIGVRKKHHFQCSCGYRAHADLNASRNLLGLGYQLMSQGLQ